MEKEYALRILQSLANGVHPGTGEQFPADSPYQHADIVRALFESIRTIQGAPAHAAVQTQRSGSAPGNTGIRWTRDEEEQLASAFDAGKTVDEIVRRHNRSRAAIEARLVKLGKLDPSAVTVPLRYPPKPPGNPSRKTG